MKEAELIGMPISESQLKKSVEDYLGWQKNLGKLIYFRLNSGDFIVVQQGESRRRVKGCPAGTADYLVIPRPQKVSLSDFSQRFPNEQSLVPLFIELKSDRGRQTKEQKEFQTSVEGFGCRYYIIRSVDELIEVLK